MKLFTKKQLAKFLAFNLFMCVSTISFSADYYWVGGSGTWNQLAHWASTPTGPGGAYAVQPSSNDNVFFTVNSGFTAANKTITMTTGATSTCRNLTFDPALNGLGVIIAGTVTARFDLNGSMTLATGMNFTGWTGDWYYYQSTTGAVNTLNTRGNLFYNTNIYFNRPSSGTGGDFVVNDDFRVISNSTPRYVHVNLQNLTSRVTFNGTNNQMPRYLNVIYGEMHINGYWQDPYQNTNNAHATYVEKDGKLYNYADATIGRLLIEGAVYLNAGNTAAGNTIHARDVADRSTTVPAGAPMLLDFHNSRLNISYSFAFAGTNVSTLANHTINAAGSTLRFLPTGTEFQFSQHTFNNVIVEESQAGTFRFYGGVSGGGTNTPTIDSLIVDRNMTYDVVQYASGNIYLQITGLKRFTAGHIYNFINTTRLRYDMVGGATLDMQGTCDGIVQLGNTTHQLSGVGPMLLSNVWFGPNAATALGTAAPYSAGTNSKSIPGTVLTGWTVSPAPAPRNLVWVGGCNESPVVTLPTTPVNQSNVADIGLTFVVTDSMILQSTDVYVTNTHTSDVSISFRIYDASNVQVGSTTAIFPPGITDALHTLNFNTALTPGTYTIRRFNNSTFISLRYNTGTSFPVNIVANDTRCKVGEITGGTPTASNYTFYNWKVSGLSTATSKIKWYDSQNWADITALSGGAWMSNPSLAPGNRGYAPTCPPTEIDSVVFPNNSFVFCDQPTMFTEGMNWLGAGEIYGTQYGGMGLVAFESANEKQF
jgi:hypothetical protein